VVSLYGKGRKYRKIPLSNEVKTTFDKYIDFMGQIGRTLTEHDYIFQPINIHKKDISKNIKYSEKSIEKIVKNYTRMAGIEKRITPHSLRATMITHLREEGVELAKISELAGHSSEKTTEGYVKRKDGPEKSAALKVKYLKNNILQ
jgi:integrase/recombinase XerD